jgi:hypothetical protein
MDDFHKDVVKNMTEGIGWSITGVADRPSFTYSTGLTQYGLPELIVSGLPPDVSAFFINKIGSEMKEGKKIELGKKYSSYTESGLPMVFIEVGKEEMKEKMTVTGCHFKDGFKALQLVWCDTKGKLPWEEEFEEKFIELQHILGEVS